MGNASFTTEPVSVTVNGLPGSSVLRSRRARPDSTQVRVVKALSAQRQFTRPREDILHDDVTRNEKEGELLFSHTIWTFGYGGQQVV